MPLTIAQHSALDRLDERWKVIAADELGDPILQTPNGATRRLNSVGRLEAAPTLRRTIDTFFPKAA